MFDKKRFENDEVNELFEMYEALEDRSHQTHAFYSSMFMELINLLKSHGHIDQSEIDHMMDRLSLAALGSDMGDYGNLLVDLMRKQLKDTPKNDNRN